LISEAIPSEARIRLVRQLSPDSKRFELDQWRPRHEDVDRDKVEMDFTGRVLTVSLPKAGPVRKVRKFRSLQLDRARPAR
jgi:hypothetical protein